VTGSEEEGDSMKIKYCVPEFLVAAFTSIALFGLSPVWLNAQEEVLKAPSDSDLQALRSMREPLQMFGLGPLPLMSADSQALQALNDAASGGADDLRAIIDLVAVYDNMQCASDRAIIKPLLEDRLHLYARLLGIEAEKAALPLGPPSIIKLPETAKAALAVRDELVAAKNKLDAIAASLK
jgi:hypothetical protein